jgi:hypothetical protein
MKLDIHDATVVIVILAVLGAVASIWSGFRSIRKSRAVAYYHLRRQKIAAGWKTIIFAIVLVGIAYLFERFGEPVAYRYFPPSPSPSLTPSITLTPTISLTPTITDTPTITLTPVFSYTPTVTSTPFLPIVFEAQFKSLVTPNPDAVFSLLKFSLLVNNFQPINPQTVFQNPVSHIIATYSYDGMLNGVQWTCIWYQNGQVITDQSQTLAWDSGTGGWGQRELTLPAERWVPGIYQLVFFVGTEWKVLGEFRIVGEPPTPTNTPVPSLTRTPSRTSTITNTPKPTWTHHPTETRWPSKTPTK